MIKPSFYFSWVLAPPCLTAQLSSFSTSSSGIVGSFKLQLVSTCCCLATHFYSHNFFLFLCGTIYIILYSPSSLEGMCQRGIAPSCTIVTRDTYFSCAIFPFPPAGGAGMVRHFKCHFCLSLPCHPNVKNLCGGVHVIIPTFADGTY